MAARNAATPGILAQNHKVCGATEDGRACDIEYDEGQSFHIKHSLLRKPMVNKIYESIAAALADIKDGSTILVGGFGNAGMPFQLIDGLIEQGARDLVVVSNNAGNAEVGLGALLKAGRVRK